VEPQRARVQAAAERIEKEREKQQTYCRAQKEKTRALVELTQKMAICPMFELDDRKDQLLQAKKSNFCVTTQPNARENPRLERDDNPEPDRL